MKPLPEIVGRHHPDLNEVFFTDVEVPASQLVGQLNNGWAMANGSLAHERGMVWLGAVMGLQEGRCAPARDAPGRLAKLGPSERGRARRSDRALVRRRAGRALPRLPRLREAGARRQRARAGADEADGSEARQRLALVGRRARGRARSRRLAADGPFTEWTWLEHYFVTFGGTISAGTSEIQRNIIAEKVLGLPRG